MNRSILILSLCAIVLLGAGCEKPKSAEDKTIHTGKGWTNFQVFENGTVKYDERDTSCRYFIKPGEYILGVLCLSEDNALKVRDDLTAAIDEVNKRDKAPITTLSPYPREVILGSPAVRPSRKSFIRITLFPPSGRETYLVDNSGTSTNEFPGSICFWDREHNPERCFKGDYQTEYLD